MKLFEVKGWDLVVTEEAWGLLPFKRLLERDTTKEKEVALKEALFIYFFCDIKSNYLSFDKEIRTSEIKKDIGLDEDWEMDSAIEEACQLYLKLNQSVIEKLYLQALHSAEAIGNYLENTAELLEERGRDGKPVYDISKITIANEKIPKLMANLKLAYREVVKEREDNENKKKGARKFNMYEDGI